MLNPLFNRQIRILPTHTSILLSHPLNCPISLLIDRRSRKLRRNLIPMDKDPRLRLKEPVDILQTPVCCLGIEKVRDRDEREAYHGPDDPEAPFEVRDAGRCNFGDHVVHLSE